METRLCKKGHLMKLYVTNRVRRLKDGTLKESEKKQWRCPTCHYKKYGPPRVKKKKRRQSTASRFCEVHKITKQMSIKYRDYISKKTGKQHTIKTKHWICIQCHNEGARRRYREGYRKPGTQEVDDDHKPYLKDKFSGY